MKRTSPAQKIILMTFGLFLCAILLEVGLRIGGFIFISSQGYRNIISLKGKDTYRIICLGESTTALGGEYSYPRQLEEVLNQRCMGMKFSVINKGMPGSDITTIVSRLEDYLNEYNPDMVITMMGINDEADAYGDTFSRKVTLLLNSFRTYKLLKLL